MVPVKWPDSPPAEARLTAHMRVQMAVPFQRLMVLLPAVVEVTLPAVCTAPAAGSAFLIPLVREGYRQKPVL